jgi:peptide/nickel transport system substrate-binding protein
MERINYWSRRASRRGFLGAGAAAGAGAAGLALVGCGGGDDNGGSSLSSLATPTPAAGVTPTVVDPFAGAKKGGTYRWYATGDPPTIDPHGNLSFLTKYISAYVYSRLYKYKPGPGLLRANVRPTPDLAQSAENTPDGLKWTVKLKPGVKFHNVAPVNGRELNSTDVKYSWGRLSDPKNAASAQVNFVDKVEYPDASTIVFSLKQPNVVFLDIIADSNLLWIMPSEADGKFDPTKTMIGSGPWLFDSYQTSVAYKMKRNPEWHVPGFPLMDGVEVAIIPEYANYLAQFRAGSLDTLDPNAADLGDVAKMKDVQVTSFINQGANWLWFDGNDPNAPYVKDERIRQALSMCADRDALTDLAYDHKRLKAAGLETKDGWNNLMGAGWGRFWLDPKGDKAGDGGKYFKYDPAEAKKLLSAAGYTDSKPLEVTYQYTANRYGKNFNDSAEAMQGYIAALGSVKATTDVQDYSSKYITQTFVGNFKGVAFGLETGFAEVGSYPIRLFTDNGNNHGKVKDPTLLKMTTDQQLESNDEKRVAIFHDMQRYHATKMWYIPLQVGAGETWRVHQPAMRNAGNYYTLGYGHPTESLPYFWKA